MSISRVGCWIAVAAIAAGCGEKAAHVRGTTPPVAPIDTATAPAAPPAVPTPPPARTPVAATIVTNRGDLHLALFNDLAPKAVANFVVLAVGAKIWTDPGSGQPLQRPFYDGTVFHRILPDLLIQGGLPLVTDSTATTTGSGVQIEDEPGARRRFDKPGLVALAGPGPGGGGGQFFITAAPIPWLDGKHVVFGELKGDLDRVRSLSKLPRDSDDRPLEPIVIRQVRIDYR